MVLPNVLDAVGQYKEKKLPIPAGNTNLVFGVDIETEFLLGYLNSNLASYFLGKIINTSLGGMSGHVTPENIKRLPILLPTMKKSNEFDEFPRDKTDIAKDYDYYLNNISFGSVSAEVLYSMIRHFKPRKIIEIGSGFSTLCSATAIRKNYKEDKNYSCDFLAIEPYPNELLRRGFPGFTKLIQKKVQEVPLSVFKDLNENDILFIDSSHVIKIGSDVQYEYLEIIPRLNKGVLIHIHDILLPSEYFRGWITRDQMFFNEQYLLQAFLAFNNNFEVLWSGSYMHLNHPDKLEQAFKSYNRKRIISHAP